MTYNLNSVIDNGFDIKNTFDIIINFYDPHKSKNLKSKILDVTNTYFWNDDNKYIISKSRNLTGYVKDNKYNIILFEPPKNKKFEEETNYYAEQFFKLLYNPGILIVKTNDFRYDGKLKGSFDIKTIFENNNFYLYDNIIYKNSIYFDYNCDNKQFTTCSKIIHSNFLIFKQKSSESLNNLLE
jgi:hypothetical protein